MRSDMTDQPHPAIDDAIRRELERRLEALAAEEGVRLLLAVESGSRAWGFPSPDSDYDVRFVYVRDRDTYLSLTQARDVIEQPIVDEIDLNGWDLRKALKLLLKSNAVVSEWMESPIRYRAADPMIDDLAALADCCFNPQGYALHYASLGRKSAEKWLGEDGDVPVKRYFYSLRPALAIRALRRDPNRRPPMNMAALVESGDVPHELRTPIEDLVALKVQTKEAGNAARMPALDQFIAAELDRAGEVPVRRPADDCREAADTLFRKAVGS